MRPNPQHYRRLTDAEVTARRRKGIPVIDIGHTSYAAINPIPNGTPEPLPYVYRGAGPFTDQHTDHASMTAAELADPWYPVHYATLTGKHLCGNGHPEDGTTRAIYLINCGKCKTTWDQLIKARRRAAEAKRRTLARERSQP